ncbi:MAG: L,D-transpeptidase family protein, partial [Oscillospiraceae bacterium]|nr:L,D-transpeptidase family protein [Oscillospiraceae bacterium]
ELWIHSITYKGHNGKTVLDGRLGARVSHGCIRLATKDAKWIYDNVPSYSRCIIYKKKFL